jgi:hypothetical protein
MRYRLPLRPPATWWRPPVDPAHRIDRGAGRGALLALVRCATAPPELTRDVRETYDFTIGDERFHIMVAGGVAAPRSGPAPVAAEVTVECDLPTLVMLDAGALTPAAARRQRGARIVGPAPAVRRALGIMRRHR